MYDPHNQTSNYIKTLISINYGNNGSTESNLLFVPCVERVSVMCVCVCVCI